jgi:MFS family permease
MKIDNRTPNSINKLISHLLPALISIAIFQVIAIEIYFFNPLSFSKINFTIWGASQAVGGYLIGFISDKLNRKNILILTQICGMLLLFPMLFFGVKQWWMLLFLGLTFSPTAVARAALIDNFPNESKIKIIGITFIALFIPWLFFTKISEIESFKIIILSLIVIFLNLLLTAFVFEDKRDLKSNHNNRVIIKKKNRMRGFYTALALLPGQVVFFVSDSFFEEYAKNASFFTALGVGVLIGAVVSIFYRKTPHISILTVCYGIGFIFCLLSVISVWIISVPNINLSIEVMLFSTLGGFYLPFVYDVILSSTSVDYRGTICGLIEGITSLSAFIGLATILLFKPNKVSILMLMTFFFFLATIIQKKAEKANG